MSERLIYLYRLEPGTNKMLMPVNSLLLDVIFTDNSVTLVSGEYKVEDDAPHQLRLVSMITVPPTVPLALPVGRFRHIRSGMVNDLPVHVFEDLYGGRDE